jgi:hypothetical protein
MQQMSGLDFDLRWTGVTDRGVWSAVDGGIANPTPYSSTRRCIYCPISISDIPTRMNSNVFSKISPVISTAFLIFTVSEAVLRPRREEIIPSALTSRSA